MPAKKKPSQADWHECLACKCAVSFRDLSKHKEECGSQLTHGYVQGGDVVLVVSEWSVAGELVSSIILTLILLPKFNSRIWPRKLQVEQAW